MSASPLPPAERRARQVRQHAAWFRRVTRLYPASFRVEYEEPMLQIFRDQVREALDCEERGALLGLWGRAVMDSVASLPREHWRAMRSRLQRSTRTPARPSVNSVMPNTPVRRLPWRWVPILAFVSGVIGTAIAARVPNWYRANSVIQLVSRGPGGKGSPQAVPLTADALLNLMVQDVVVKRVQMKLAENPAQPGKTNAVWRPSLSARQGPGNTFLMSVEGSGWTEAREFAVAWAHEVVDFYSQLRGGELNNWEAANTQQILTFQRKLETVSQALDDFRHKNRISIPSLKHQELVSKRAEYEALLREKVQVEESRKIRLGPAISTNPMFELQFEIRKLENRLALAPDDAHLKSEMALKKADLKALNELVESSRDEQLLQLERKIKALVKPLEEAMDAELESTAVANEEKRLVDEESMIRAQLDALNTQELEFTRLRAVEPTLVIMQAGGGTPTPVGPNRPWIIASSVGFGGLAGLVVMLAIALSRRSPPPTPPGAMSLGAGMAAV